MKAALIAATFSILAVAPAAAQSCVSNGAFVPCQGGMGAGMSGGMAPGAMAPGTMGRPAPGMQPAGAGMSGGPAMAERRHASRRTAKRVKRSQQAESADQ
jgi:hypothetical protein